MKKLQPKEKNLKDLLKKVETKFMKKGGRVKG